MKKGRVRRLLLLWPAGFLSAGLALSVAFGGAPTEAGSQTLGISQGSIATHPYVEVSAGPFPGYSQVVDNTTQGRFEAPGWEVLPGSGLSFGADYARASNRGVPARFKVDIPATGYYSVYAWWPAQTGNSATTRFGVTTTSGTQWTEVDQRVDGGMWVKLGAYEMGAGDYYAIQVSGGSGGGEVVADAVQVLSGEQASPEEATGEEAAGDDAAFSAQARGGKTKGSKVVRRARSHLGTPYRLSPPHPCRAYRMEDCSCHTKVVFRTFGKKLVDSPTLQ